MNPNDSALYSNPLDPRPITADYTMHGEPIPSGKMQKPSPVVPLAPRLSGSTAWNIRDNYPVFDGEREKQLESDVVADILAAERLRDADPSNANRDRD